MIYTVHPVDCRQAMRLLMAPDSADSIVTDPPYDLTSIVKRYGGPNAAPQQHGTDGAFARAARGFMGKTWDGTGVAFDAETWREAYRVLKPGGWLLAFGGTRTYHRMVCAIEDAGFEIRDMIAWVYSTGFPKSHNVDNMRGKTLCDCEGGTLPETHDRTAPQSQYDVRSMLETDLSSGKSNRATAGEILQSGMSQQSISAAMLRAEPEEKPAGDSKCGVERGRNDRPSEGTLRVCALCQMPGKFQSNVSQGRIRNGTPLSHGEMGEPAIDESGVCSSCRPQPAKQRAPKPGIMAGQSQSQTGGAWPICGKCDKPNPPHGWGTALKPAHEPIVMARKPFKGSVAKNMLAHGTGAINIDGCRVDGKKGVPGSLSNAGGLGWSTGGNMARKTEQNGRFPANLIHDGSAEVVAGFPATAGAASPVRGDEPSAVTNGIYGKFSDRVPGAFHGDTGSAARFFYCAKASRSDRDEGCDHLAALEARANTHPTVKPTDLMRYLVRLVTPAGGVVLDPFAGSGSTGKAAILEGFQFVGCELTADYLPILSARLDHAVMTRYGKL